MYEIGRQLPACLRETSQAGLATTPTGQKLPKSWGKISSKLQRKAKPPVAQSADGLFYPQGHSAQRHIHGHHQGKAGSSAHGAGMTVGAGLGLGVQLLQHHIHHRPGGKSQQKRRHRTQSRAVSNIVSTAPTGSTAPDSTPYTKERSREQPSRAAAPPQWCPPEYFAMRFRQQGQRRPPA